MWSVRVALACGLVAIVATIAVTLSHSPLVLLGTNSIPIQTIVATTRGGASSCQGREVLPRGTTAVRLWITGNVKPAVRVEAFAGQQLVTSGSQSGGWLGKVITVPVTPVAYTIRDAQLCFTIGQAVEGVDLLGGRVRHPARGESAGKMRVEYLRAAPSSWWSLERSVARHLGLGRAPAGEWVFLIPLTLMTLAAILAAWTVLRQLGRRRPLSTSPPSSSSSSEHRRLRALLRCVPGPAWICMCVAFMSAASWSVLTPPFEVTDEPSHFSYVQILAETGGLPKSQSFEFSQEELTALKELEQNRVHFNVAVTTLATAAQQQNLQQALGLPLSRIGRGAGVAAPQPPLYYALEAIPYYLGSGGTLLDQLALMRLLSALMAGFAALFAFLFLREALPGVPWAWTVGGLGMALAPLVGFIGGAVNPDAMLCAVSAALFYVLARAFRRGLTPRMGVAIGVVMAVGFLTKLNFIGLAPGVLLALLLLTRRARATSGSAAYRSLALALAIGVGPVSCTS